MYDVDTPNEKCLMLAKAVYKMAQKSLQLKLEKTLYNTPRTLRL